MIKDRKLEDTVWSFLDRAGSHIARLHEERFRQEMHANCLERGLESPIEDLFWIACMALCEANFVDANPCPGSAKKDAELPSGFYITPQMQIDKYRVDFLITCRSVRHDLDNPKNMTPVHSSAVVELDGHDFHDKDKRQRSYEKRRDRDLQRAGYKVLHFTGSDMVKDPFACAREAMELVGVHFFGGEYNAADPLDLGNA